MQLSFRRSPSRILIAGILCVVFFLGAILGWTNKHFFSEDDRFQSFTEKLFQQEVSGNMLTLHYSLAYPERRNIPRPNASLGTVSPPSSETSEALTEILEELKSFDFAELSEENQQTLDTLLLYYKTQNDFQDCSILDEPLSPSLGIQAQLPVLLAEYSFYQEQDIADYLNLLVSIEPYFKSILAYEYEKSRQGYFMSDTTLDRILAQCQAFIKDPASNYMLDIFADKIKEFGKLSQEDQDELIKKHREILLNKVIPAYRNLIDGLQSLRGTGRPSQGLAHFRNGKKYYEYLLQSQTGSYIPVKDMQKRLTEQLADDMDMVQKILKEQPSLLRKLNGSLDLPQMEPTEILAALSQKTSEDFPFLETPEYSVRSVHKSMQDYLSPAFYLTPPLDTASPNVIYINPADQSTNLELFTTLSHEGFPGHLYQTVFFSNTNPSNIRYLITSSGYVEGWATYAESYGYQYAADFLDDKAASDYVRLAWLNRSVNLCIYSLLDISIHYYGWSQAEAARFLRLFGISNEHAISEIYQYIVETPGNYQKYCWGYINFLDLKKEWQDALGNDFSEKEFHQNLLEIGPVQFPVLQKYMRNRLVALTSQQEVPVRTSCLSTHSYNYQKNPSVSAMLS